VVGLIVCKGDWRDSHPRRHAVRVEELDDALQ
jgi:hypothetical protein